MIYSFLIRKFYLLTNSKIYQSILPKCVTTNNILLLSQLPAFNRVQIKKQCQHEDNIIRAKEVTQSNALITSCKNSNIFM